MYIDNVKLVIKLEENKFISSIVDGIFTTTSDLSHAKEFNTIDECNKFKKKYNIGKICYIDEDGLHDSIEIHAEPVKDDPHEFKLPDLVSYDVYANLCVFIPSLFPGGH